MKQGIEAYGPPDAARIDNGKDYDSEMWTGTTKHRRHLLRRGYIDLPTIKGLYGMMDILVVHAKPYHPQSKCIERFFDTFDKQFCKTVPTYCGKDTARRPEELHEQLQREDVQREALSLEDFAAKAGVWIEQIYNHQVHQGDGMAGRSPAEVLGTRTSRRVIDKNVLDLLLRVWSGELIVGKNGITWKGLQFGQYDAAILSHQGKRVRVAYAPDDLRTVTVYDAATMKLLAIAEQNKLIAYGKAGEEDLREAMKQKARARRAAAAYKDTRLAAAMDLTNLTLAAGQARVAQRATTAAAAAAEQVQHLRPVVTPLDGQGELHRQKELQRQLRKAAGAENQPQPLEIDPELLAGRRRVQPIKLFDY